MGPIPRFQPGQTIKLQMEDEESEGQAEEEAEGGGGLYRHADLYQKSLGTFLDDATLNAVFMDRFGLADIFPRCFRLTAFFLQMDENGRGESHGSC